MTTDDEFREAILNAEGGPTYYIVDVVGDPAAQFQTSYHGPLLKVDDEVHHEGQALVVREVRLEADGWHLVVEPQAPGNGPA